jgi:Zn-dependent protease with chaperone function
MSTQRVLHGLHRHEYEHPWDAAALEALENTPGLQTLSRQILRHSYERQCRIQLTGSSVRITNTNYPDLFGLLETTCTTLCVDQLPELYIEFGSHIGASTTGNEAPILALTSASIDRLSEQELRFVLGHEVGHIKSAHCLYHLMAKLLFDFGGAVGKLTLSLGKYLMGPLNSALRSWSRMAELTADRAGLLSVQDMESAIKVFVKIAGLPKSLDSRVHVQAFQEQAKQFEALDISLINKLTKFYTTASATHPWTVLRASELIKWVESGEYQRVVDRETRHKSSVRTSGSNAFCRACSYRLAADDAFCPHCGQQIRDNLKVPN